MSCKRDAEGSNGLCEVLDLSPPLFVENTLSVNLYYEARKTAEYKDVKEGSSSYKSKLYISATNLLSLMDMFEVKPRYRISVYQKVMALQNVENDLSPIRSINGRS